MSGDFAAGFSFDFGAPSGPAEAPWEFAGAIATARKQEGTTKQTSVDAKIKKRLAARKSKAAEAASRKAAGKRKAKPDSDSDESDADSDDSEDAPLAREADTDSDAAVAENDDSAYESDDAAGVDDDSSDGVDDDSSDGAEATDESSEEDGSDDDDDGADEESDEDGDVASADEDDDVASADDDEDAFLAQRDAAVAAARAGEAESSGEEGSSDGGEESDEEESDEDESSDEDNAGGATADKKSKRATPIDSDEEGEEEIEESEDEDDNEVDDDKEVEPARRFSKAPASTSFSVGTFGELNLSRPLQKACTALGYEKPTPIQAACIPLAMAGRDIVGSAITGSGKTGAFMLPCLERLIHRPRRISATYVVVLAPTRELAAQIHSMTQKLGQFTDIRAALVVGGLSLQVQAATLRTMPEVVVATPGRLIDHVRNTQSVGLEDVNTLVLDEADRLLEMGFADEIAEIVRMAPRSRQTMLFSATMTAGVQSLVKMSLRSPVRLAADATGKAPRELEQEIVRFKPTALGDREGTLLALCGRSFRGGRTIIFFRTKHSAHRMKIIFGLAGLPPAAELHGDMTQAARLTSLEQFRKGEVAFLLCTDVAARGLDIIGVEIVVSYDAPRALATYLHRIGRTARAGRSGKSITFVLDEDRPLVKDVLKKTASNLKTRVVPPKAVAQWRGRVEKLQKEVSAVLAEEREEKMLRKAEMEATKAANMMEHEAEIFNRPARSWFQSNKAKKAAQEAAKSEEANAAESAKEAKKRSRAERRNEKKAIRAAEEKQRRKNSLATETDDYKRTMVKSIKAQERALRSQGVMPGKAGKRAASDVTGIKKEKKKRKKGDGDVTTQSAPGEGGLFSGDGTTATKTKVYSGGGSSGKIIKPKTGLSKAERAKVKRGGTGKSQFKSKSKFKRRK